MKKKFIKISSMKGVQEYIFLAISFLILFAASWGAGKIRNDLNYGQFTGREENRIYSYHDPEITDQRIYQLLSGPADVIVAVHLENAESGFLSQSRNIP